MEAQPLLLGADPYGIFGLCLTPTRELAAQIGDQFVAFSTGMTLRCEVIVGRGLHSSTSQLNLSCL